MKFAGIDPGASGAIAVVDDEGQTHVQKWSTVGDAIDFLSDHSPDFAFLERVSAMPKQGVSSTFKFGQNFGSWIGLLTGRVPFDLVTPQTWQRAMGCLSKGDKNVTKRRAQELFPLVKMTHWRADALLIAEYARRARSGA